MGMQYVITREHGVLLHALEQLNKIPLMEQRGQQERLHLKSLHSKVEGERDMSFLQSFLTPIQRWTDKQLGDYHLHFNEVCSTVRLLGNTGSDTWICLCLIVEELL